MAISNIALALMPISQCAAWYLVCTIPMPGLYTSVAEIAAFYCVWALYNRFVGGSEQELGHYSMGAAAITAYFHHRIASLIGAALVLANFLFVASIVVWKWDVNTLAEEVKHDTSSKGIFWAYTFKCYFISQILLWSYILYIFYFFK
jgi:hypothetical protein